MGLQIYANYNRQVVNNEDFADVLFLQLKMIEKSNQNKLLTIQKSQQDQNQISQVGKKSQSSKSKVGFGENSNTCVITVSVNLRDFGIIKNSNYDLMRMLAFKRSDIVELNINQLMPKIISQQHDKILQNYIENSNTKELSSSFVILAQNKHGYGVPSNLTIKMLPDLSQGLLLVGFLNELEKYFCPPYINENWGDRYTTHYIMFNPNDLQIQICTYSCYQFFGITSSLVTQNNTQSKLTLDIICPQLTDKETIQDLYKQELELGFDSQVIGQQFILSDDSNIDVLNQNNLKNNDGEEPLDISQLGKIEQIENVQQNQVNVQKQNDQADLQENLDNYYENYDPNQAHKDYLEVRYKNTVIKGQIIDYQCGQAILKFIDLNEPERFDPNEDQQEQQENQDNLNNMFQNQQNQKEQEDNEEEQEEQQQQLIKKNDIMGSQQQSKNKSKSKKTNIIKSIQEGSSLNQKSIEQRYIKDLKVAFSNKTQSRSVIILQRVSILLYLILISILIYQFFQKLSLRSNLNGSISAIYIANNRHTVMPDSNFFTRQIQMDADGFNIYEDSQQKVLHVQDSQRNLQKKVKQFHEIQFQVLDEIEKIKEFYSEPIKLSSYKLNFLMPNGVEFEDQYSVTDGMLLMVAAVSSLSYANIEDLFVEMNQQTFNTNQRYFFYVLNNGLKDLRSGSEIFSDSLQQIYVQYVTDFEGPNLILMFLNILITLSFGIILVPYIIRVQNQNNNVLSIFSIIPIEDIKNFIDQCNSFRQQFLVERSIEEILQDKKTGMEKDNQIMQIKEDKINKQLKQLNVGDNQNLDNSQNTQVNNTQISRSPDYNMTDNLIQDTIANDNFLLDNSKQVKQQNDLNQNKSFIGNKNNNFDNNKKTNNNIVERDKVSKIIEVDEDYDEDEGISRQEKVINSEKSEKKKIVIKFCVISFLFISYFIVDNILETDFLNNVKLCISHTQMMSSRPSHVKYALIFAMEEIVQGMQQWYDGSEMQSFYSQKLYENELLVEESIKDTYPSQFDEYITIFDSYNYNDICDHQIWSEMYDNDKAERGDRAYDYPGKCPELQGGVLQKGLGQSIKTIIENIRTYVTNWREYSDTGLTLEKQIEYLNSQEFKEIIQLQDYILPILDAIMQNFMEMYEDFVSSNVMVQQVTFFIIIFLISIFFFIFWTPYILNIGKKTKRIKAMLNMLPVSLILKNGSLKNALNNDGIMKEYI